MNWKRFLKFFNKRKDKEFNLDPFLVEFTHLKREEQIIVINEAMEILRFKPENKDRHRAFLLILALLQQVKREAKYNLSLISLEQSNEQIVKQVAKLKGMIEYGRILTSMLSILEGKKRKIIKGE